MKKLLANALMVVLLAALAACHGSPTAPAPTVCHDVSAINNGGNGACQYPNPAAGTTVQTFPLPDTDKLLFVWITAISPAKGSQFPASQAAGVSWKCAGPSGYSAWISDHFIKDGQTTNLLDSSGGSSFNFSSDCGGLVSSGLPAGTSGNIASFQLLVWTAKGASVSMKYPADRPADFEREEPLGWQVTK